MAGVVLIMAILQAVPGTVPTAHAQGSAHADSAAAANAVAGIAISRKVLPDVAASTVPRAEAPRRPPRLEDPLAADNRFREAQAAAAGGDFALAQVRMREALRADPHRPQFRWWFSGEVLRRFDPGAFIWSLPGTVASTLSDPLARRRLLVEMHQGTVLLVGVFWSVLVLLYLTVYWRYVSHDMSALLFRDPRHRLRTWTPWLMLAAVLAARPGWFGALALLSIPLLIQARGRNRWPLAITWLLAAFLLFPQWPALRDATPVLDPKSETNLLVRAARLPASGPVIRSLQQRLEKVEDPERRIRLQLALATQHARAGRYQSSSELLEEIIAVAPNHVPARVNLANNTYYLGRLDAAVAAYEAVRRLAPERGEIPYNLAQVYFKKLFVPEASDAMKDARALGFDPPPWEDPSGEANGYSPVVYLEPGPASLGASCRWEAGRYPPLAGLAAWSQFLGCPPLPHFLVLVSTFLLALALVRWWSNQDDPRGCDNCGAIVCRDCCEVRQGVWYCKPCSETADRARSEMVLATLLKNRSRSVGLTRSAHVALLARLVPGSGYLTVGETSRAILRAAFLALGFYGLFFAWAFDPSQTWLTPGLVLAEETVHQVWYPLPAAAWRGWSFWPVSGGAVLVILVYVTALLDGTQLRRRVPEHFLLAAGDSDRAARRAI